MLGQVKASLLGLIVGIIMLATSLASAQGYWKQVVGSSAATAAGFGDANNGSAHASTLAGDYLYVGTFNIVTGSEVWRTSDGKSWTQINTDGFGDAINVASWSMGTFGHVYAATWASGMPNTPGTDTRVWRYTGTGWVQANIDGFYLGSGNDEPYSMANFTDVIPTLYVGVNNYSTGVQIWRTDSGDSWTMVNTNGFGDPDNQEAAAMAVFGSQLYVTTGNIIDGMQVWRTSGGSSWTKVASDGFGYANNTAAYAMAVFNGYLYVCTYNAMNGLEVWRTGNGTAWSRVITKGLGDPGNWGSYAMMVFDGALYLGTLNYFTGTELWRTENGITWIQDNTDGFGDSGSFTIQTMNELDGVLYVGLWNGGGCQIWRTALFTDGFESADTSGWSVTVP